ncbi:MAG TPA: DUF2156 domain-containing protein [Chitinivibrionales bacterium]|jgi:phosphatidylglycerol lysyltransferase|nr:DUF2156 domain-containing protein [Chitinivibrionales bacterium]
MTVPDFPSRLAHVKKYGSNSFSTLLLYDDVTSFPLTSCEGFIGYRNGRKLLVVFGEPVCDPKDYRASVSEFIAFCKKNGKQFMFICCGEKFKNDVENLGFSSISIGEDFIFDTATYAPRGDKNKMIRLARNHAIRAGAVVKEYDHASGSDPALEKKFEEISVRWLKKTNRFKAHILNLNLFEHRELKRYFYAEAGGTPVAFISCLPIYARDGFLLEDVIRDPNAPYGVVELITLAVVDELKGHGGGILTFGISPKLDVSALSGPSRAVANIGMWFANYTFNLHKLYHFRKKFHASVAEPSYLLKYPKGLGLLDLARILTSF